MIHCFISVLQADVEKILMKNKFWNDLEIHENHKKYWTMEIGTIESKNYFIDYYLRS